MVATKRRFDPNLQRVRVLILNGKAQRGLRLHALPQGRQGPESHLAAARAPDRPRLHVRASTGGRRASHRDVAWHESPLRSAQSDLRTATSSVHRRGGGAALAALGRITISSDAIAQIVGRDRRASATASSAWPRAAASALLPASGRRRASRSAATATAVTVDLHVVVEYGLNLAEVAVDRSATGSPTRSSG